MVPSGLLFPSASVRLDMLDEAAQIIKSMFANRTTTFEGTYFKVEGAFCEPKPRQKDPEVVGMRRRASGAPCKS